LPGELLEALSACHAARRSGAPMSGDAVSVLYDASEAFVSESDALQVVEAAWLAIDATGLGRAAHRLLCNKTLIRALGRDRKRGWTKVEAELRADPALPASFRANPAQHFYALQNLLAERRRQQWREACDREPDSFELAA
jgi:hypothetical protein